MSHDKPRRPIWVPCYWKPCFAIKGDYGCLENEILESPKFIVYATESAVSLPQLTDFRETVSPSAIN